MQPVEMKAAHSSKPATGKRVITNGKKGTIAFLGETEFSTGEWIGIVVRDGREGSQGVFPGGV